MSVDLNYFTNVFWDILRNYSSNEYALSGEREKSGGDIIDLLNTDRDNVIKLRLMGRERLYLKKVADALQRIKDGTFGVCNECGEDIEFRRLNARPTANMCISCKEGQEREENRIIYHKKSHTLGKKLNTNVIDLPIKSEEISKEDDYLFNRDMKTYRPV